MSFAKRSQFIAFNSELDNLIEGPSADLSGAGASGPERIDGAHHVPELSNDGPRDSDLGANQIQGCFLEDSLGFDEAALSGAERMAPLIIGRPDPKGHR